MPQPVSYNTGTPTPGSIQENSISYVVDGQQRDYRGGYSGLSWMSEAPAENNVIFIGNTTNIGRGPANKLLFYPSFNTSDANIIYTANTLPGSPRNLSTVAGAYSWAANNNFFINSANNPIPRIDADGLVLYLNASLPSSYPGTDNTWFDLSGYGNNATLFNGLNSNWNSRGYFEFDGADDYASIDYDAASMAAWTGSQTIIFWEYHTFEDGSRRNFWNQAYGGAGTWTHEGGYSINYFYGNSGVDNVPYTALNSSTTPRGKWQMLTTTRDPSQVNWYINNTNTSNMSNPYGVLALTTNNISIGIGYTGQYWAGNIGAIAAYNKALTQAEVNQVYFQGDIITSSLSYLWDASNLISYPRAGTVTYNLTGSISGSLTNGTGYTNSNGGCWVFDGVDDYILLENSLLSITPGNGNWTLSAWVKGPWSSGTFYPIVGNTSGGPVASGFAIYQNKIYYQNYDGNWQSHYGNTTLNPNTWYHLTWVNYAGASAALGTMKMYVNAVADSSTFNSYTTNGGPVNAIGSAYNGIFSGNIASVQWNIGTAFNDQQVAQQYEATKYKFQGATIPLNGLVLNLDATNKNSYPGTGTTWYDLSGNSNNGTLVNGTSWNPSGYMSTDAVDDYIQIADAASLRFTTGFTQVIWVKLNNTITDYYRNLFGKPNYVCYGMIVEWYGGNPILYDFLVGGNRNALGLNYPGSNWVMVAQSYNASGGSNNQIGYINGGASNVLYATRTGNVDINTEPMYIGQSGLSMNVGLALAYNRGLTLSELDQIYNATKTRFGY